MHVSSAYDDIEIEDMEWSDTLQAFTYPCPCGDVFQISIEVSILRAGCARVAAAREGGGHAGPCPRTCKEGLWLAVCTRTRCPAANHCAHPLRCCRTSR